MKQLVTPLSLLVLLLAAACGKDTPAPEPAPNLQGRWNVQSSTVFNYSVAGQLLGKENVPDKSFYLVVTKDSLLFRDVRNGSSWGSHKYTWQGTELLYGPVRCTITELTQHALTLHYANISRVPGTPYQEISDHYTR